MDDWIDRFKCASRDQILEWMAEGLTDWDFCLDADRDGCRKNVCIRTDEEIALLCELDDEEDNEQLSLF